VSTILDSGTGKLNYGRQTAKGTKATAATTTVGYNQPKWRDGGLGPNMATASERFVDGQRFGSPAIFIDTAAGQVGTLTIQAQPENAGLFPAQILGTDTVTGSADPWTHTIITSTAQGKWGTWWLKVGSEVGPSRIAYWDSKLTKLVMNCGQQQKPMHFDLEILALTVESFATDAAKTEDATDPYYFTESEGALELDGAVIDSIQGEVFEVDTNPTPQYANSIAPFGIVEGEPFVATTLATVFTDATLKKFNKVVFGSEAPGAGVPLVTAVTSMTVKTKYKKSATRTFTIERPNVAVDTKDLKTEAKPDGGTVPLAFTGHCRKGVSAEPAVTVIALSGDSTTYA
jgi:hypothetical protein